MPPVQVPFRTLESPRISDSIKYIVVSSPTIHKSSFADQPSRSLSREKNRSMFGLVPKRQVRTLELDLLFKPSRRLDSAKGEMVELERVHCTVLVTFRFCNPDRQSWNYIQGVAASTEASAARTEAAP